MNKKLFATLISGLILGTSTLSPMALTVSAANYTDEADNCFLSYIVEDGVPQEAINEVTYNRTPLYDQTLTQNGWQYNFTFGETEGYALITQLEIDDALVYEGEEINYAAASPFDNCDGLPVYITHRTYLLAKDGTFYDIIEGEEVSAETLNEYVLAGFGYLGTGTHYNVTETISYASKSVTEEYSFPYNMPAYMATGETSCANVAGAVLIGYYDRFYEELIPDYQTYIMLGGSYLIYTSDGQEVSDVMNSLYTLMSTDVGQQGTTFSGFHTGMNSYVSGKGRSYSYTSAFTLGSFSFSKFKTAVNAGKPVALFLSKYALVLSTTAGAGKDTIVNQCSDVGHVAIAYGYKVETYYNAAGNVIDTRYYLKISIDSITFSDYAYLNINGLSTLDNASAITIQ